MPLLRRATYRREGNLPLLIIRYGEPTTRFSFLTGEMLSFSLARPYDGTSDG